MIGPQPPYDVSVKAVPLPTPRMNLDAILTSIASSCAKVDSTRPETLDPAVRDRKNYF